MDQIQRRLLVIDDEKGLRDMLVYGLSSRGYAVATAEGGREAVALASRQPFDLALCDIMMPEMGGIEALGLLKEAHPALEVVMATGYATLENAVSAMKLGAYDYISKPYDLDALCAVLDKAWERGRLKAKVGELENLSRMKSEFLATMSHELRTPLNAIVGYSSLIVDRTYGDVPPAQALVLDRVLVNAQDLLSLIDGILDFSKLNAGMLPARFETFDVSAVALEVADMLRGLAEGKGLAFVVDAPEPVIARSDRVKVKQIFVNLASNAVKFTSKGSVTLRVRAAGPDAVRLRVEDTGMGVSVTDVPRLFREFVQLDGAATRRFGGTGLGLSITKKLAELLGGTVVVESEVGEGSAFTVTLAQNAGADARELQLC